MDFVPCNRKENCFSYFAIFILLGGIWYTIYEWMVIWGYTRYCGVCNRCIMDRNSSVHQYSGWVSFYFVTKYRPHSIYTTIFIYRMCHSNKQKKIIIIIHGERKKAIPF